MFSFAPATLGYSAAQLLGALGVAGAAPIGSAAATAGSAPTAGAGSTAGVGSSILQSADIALVFLGTAIALAAAFWWLVRSRSDPLALAPRRAHNLREDAIFLAVLAYLTTFLVVSGLLRLAAGEGVEEMTAGAAGGAAQLIGGAACLWIAGRTFAGGAWRFCMGSGGSRGRQVAWTMPASLVAVGVCLGILYVTAAAIGLVLPEYQPPSHSVIEALREQSQPLGVRIGLWLGAALIAPVAEECFFRGLVQTYVGSVLKSRWAGIAITALLFGLVHFPQPHAVPALVFLGVLLGYAYERSGALWPPIVIHALFNLKSLIWEALA